MKLTFLMTHFHVSGMMNIGTRRLCYFLSSFSIIYGENKNKSISH